MRGGGGEGEEEERCNERGRGRETETETQKPSETQLGLLPQIQVWARASRRCPRQIKLDVVLCGLVPEPDNWVHASGGEICILGRPGRYLYQSNGRIRVVETKYA